MYTTDSVQKLAEPRGFEPLNSHVTGGRNRPLCDGSNIQRYKFTGLNVCIQLNSSLQRRMSYLLSLLTYRVDHSVVGSLVSIRILSVATLCLDSHLVECYCLIAGRICTFNQSGLLCHESHLVEEIGVCERIRTVIILDESQGS
jgi:hypothetical protein